MPELYDLYSLNDGDIVYVQSIKRCGIDRFRNVTADATFKPNRPKMLFAVLVVGSIDPQQHPAAIETDLVFRVLEHADSYRKMYPELAAKYDARKTKAQGEEGR